MHRDAESKMRYLAFELWVFDNFSFYALFTKIVKACTDPKGVEFDFGLLPHHQLIAHNA